MNTKLSRDNTMWQNFQETISKYCEISEHHEISFKKVRKYNVHPFNQEYGVPDNCIPCSRYHWHQNNCDGSTFVLNNVAGSKSSYLKTTETKFQPISLLPTWETFPRNWKLKKKGFLANNRETDSGERKQTEQTEVSNKLKVTLLWILTLLHLHEMERWAWKKVHSVPMDRSCEGQFLTSQSTENWIQKILLKIR